MTKAQLIQKLDELKEKFTTSATFNLTSSQENKIKDMIDDLFNSLSSEEDKSNQTDHISDHEDPPNDEISNEELITYLFVGWIVCTQRI